jgi:magnesium-transporting ATPase (P-type)
MMNEAELSANLKTKSQSSDYQAVVDVSLKDFSAISQLLFKHGNQIQMRLSKAVQAFYYRALFTFLVIFSHITISAFSGSIPFTDSFYLMFMIFLSPLEILVYATFYKDYAYDYLYKINGHYQYNFSFSIVEFERAIIDTFGALIDWVINSAPFILIDMGPLISSRGRTVQY